MLEIKPVSLIITHFKQEKLLVELLSYLQENDWAYASEVIIVDDCSLSKKKLENINSKFSKVKTLQTMRNSGPSYARNFGVQHAAGKYIQFLDADDWISPTKIVIQYDEASSKNFPSFICSNWARVDYRSKPNFLINIQNFRPLLKNPLPIYLIAANNFIPLMSGLILRSAFIDVNGFNEEMTLIEDVNLNIRLFQKHSRYLFLNSEIPLFFYRSNNSSSLSRSNGKLFNRGVLTNYFVAKSSCEATTAEHELILLEVLWNVYKNATLTKDKLVLKKVITELKKYKVNTDLRDPLYFCAANTNYLLFSYFYFIYNTSAARVKSFLKREIPGIS